MYNLLLGGIPYPKTTAMQQNYSHGYFICRIVQYCTFARASTMAYSHTMFLLRMVVKKYKNSV